ncbi:MAG: hypothetical protein DSM106950_22560 [Stigonema ocellatum SAG 48.90 = DSM 106950]|nr:hypothetical protein [Stigonema ocellatum SAG 48.90 = DSM 106950]
MTNYSCYYNALVSFDIRKSKFVKAFQRQVMLLSDMGLFNPQISRKAGKKAKSGLQALQSASCYPTLNPISNN